MWCEIDQTYFNVLKEANCINSCGRLLPIITPSVGNCLVDSVSMECFGRFDHDYRESSKLHKYLLNAPKEFKKRWKLQQEFYNYQDQFSLEPNEWTNEWAIVVTLASKKFKEGTKILHSLESVHVFALANIYRRAIIVIADKHHEFNKVTRFSGIFLPILIKPEKCCKEPVIIVYHQSHFMSMVVVEGSGHRMYPIDNQLIDMPYCAIGNKTSMTKQQKLKLLKQYVDITHINENGQSFICVNHTLPTITISGEATRQ